MKRTGGGRPSVAGAMSRQGQLEPLGRSSPLSKEEQEIKALKKENQKLKSNLADIKSLYKQLVEENTHEKFDERRVTLLKSQIIQLERQLLLLNEALTSRGEVLYEVENNLQWLADKCRSYICQDSRGPQVHMDRSELTLMVETAESARIKLYKQLESNTTQNLSRPLRFYSDFLNQDATRDEDVTLLDVASGRLDHINLKHVPTAKQVLVLATRNSDFLSILTKLESKLSTLYRDLIHLHSMMEEETGSDSTHLWTSCHVTSAPRERLMTQILTSCARMKDCSSDLLELSILYPSAPWPPLKRCALKDITAERVMRSLPGARSRSQETIKVIQALVKAYNYKVYMLNNKNEYLRGEVKYHKKVYNLQLKYTESLFEAIREAYNGFEETSNELLVKPLKEILEAYLDLSQSASEVSLKKFVSTFKDHVPQLSDIVETYELKEDKVSDGSKVLSQYGEEFFEALENLVKDHQHKRDREVNKMEDIKAEQEKLDTELRELLEEQEERIHNKLLEDLARKNESIVSDEQVTKQNTSRASEFDREIETMFTEGNSGSERSVSERNRRLKKKIFDRDENYENHSIFAEDISRSRSLVCEKNQRLVNKAFEQEEIGIDDEETELSDAELLAFHKRQSKTNTPSSQEHSHDTLPPRDSRAAKPPEKVKPKKKLGYVPNTFVPNRTLQLRRSGSLTKVNSLEQDHQGRQNADESLDNQALDNKDRQSRPKSKESSKLEARSKSSVTEKQVKSRPAFR